MFTALLAIFILFVFADAFLSGSVIHHLRAYSLPGWTLAKIIVPVHLGLSLLFLSLALYFLLQISN